MKRAQLDNRHRALLVGLVAIAISACGTASVPISESPIGASDTTPTASDTTWGKPFSNPERVTILGYDDDAMEPFLTRDGRFLFFNNRNLPEVNTDLFYAERIDDLTFEFRGPVEGANGEALDAVASLADDGWLYFVSLRSYDEDFSLIYRGRFADGVVTDVELVKGISDKRPPIGNFDVEVSPDGSTLYYVRGRFDVDAGFWADSDLLIATWSETEFVPLAESATILAEVNSDALEFAAAITADGRELFFTRADPAAGLRPAIYHTVRDDVTEPFAPPRLIEAIDVYAEAATPTPDGNAIYYHVLEEGSFVVYRVSR